MRYTEVISDIKDMADEAGLGVDKFMASAVVLEKRQKAEEARRRSTPEEKSSIDSFLNALNGQILNEDISVSDVLLKAGVPKKQGTSAYARSGIKKLQLTYAPAAAE